MGDYSRECVIASPEANGGIPSDPMVMVYETESPRGGVNYTLPSSAGHCRFRIKFYEHTTCASATCASNPATLTLAGQTVWASNDEPTTSWDLVELSTSETIDEPRGIAVDPLTEELLVLDEAARAIRSFGRGLRRVLGIPALRLRNFDWLKLGAAASCVHPGTLGVRSAVAVRRIRHAG